MQEDSSNAVGTPYSRIYTGRSPTTYSCVTDCMGAQYEVHVIGMYSSLYNLRDENVTVEMTVCGHSSKPLVLVLISYQAQQWTVNVPNGVTIERVLVVSRVTLFLTSTSSTYIWTMTGLLYHLSFFFLLFRVPTTQTGPMYPTPQEG